MKRIAAAIIALVALVGVTVPTSAAPAPAPVHSQVSQRALQLGDEGMDVAQVQQVLASYGYSLAVDGVFGPVTDRIVRLWQQQNGLLVDGIVGPVTRASLGINGTLSEDTNSGLRTEPAPNPGITQSNQGYRCPQYHNLLISNGLQVDFFDYVMYRESGCQPGAYNGRNNDRSYGLLQINTKGALWGELQRRCGLTAREQLFDPSTNIACAARLYAAYGKAPWS